MYLNLTCSFLDFPHNPTVLSHTCNHLQPATTPPEFAEIHLPMNSDAITMDQGHEVEELCQLFAARSPHAGRRDGRPKTTFMTLPLEVREMIYAFAMDELPAHLILGIVLPRKPTVSGFGKFTLQPNALPNICFVSKQIWLEACLVYIRRTEFRLTCWHPKDSLKLHAWLGQLPDKLGYMAVRKLTFDRAYGTSDMPPLVLQSGRDNIGVLGPLYTGIQTLTLEIDVWGLRNVAYSHAYAAHKECSFISGQGKERFKGSQTECMRTIIRSHSRLEHLKVICKGWGWLWLSAENHGTTHWNKFFNEIFTMFVESFACRDKLQLEVKFDDKIFGELLGEYVTRIYYHPLNSDHATGRD